MGDSHHGCAADKLQQQPDAVMSVWSYLSISEENFQQLLIKAVLKEKGGPTWFKQGVPNKVSGDCVYLCYHRSVFLFCIFS